MSVEDKIENRGGGGGSRGRKEGRKEAEEAEEAEEDKEKDAEAESNAVTRVSLFLWPLRSFVPSPIRTHSGELGVRRAAWETLTAQVAALAASGEESGRRMANMLAAVDSKLSASIDEVGRGLQGERLAREAGEGRGKEEVGRLVGGWVGTPKRKKKVMARRRGINIRLAFSCIPIHFPGDSIFLATSSFFGLPVLRQHPNHRDDELEMLLP